MGVPPRGLNVVAVSLPSSSQAVNQNKCLVIVCIDWLDILSLLYRLCVLCSYGHFTPSSVFYCLYEESSAHISFCLILFFCFSSGEIKEQIAYMHVWFGFAWWNLFVLQVYKSDDYKVNLFHCNCKQMALLVKQDGKHLEVSAPFFETIQQKWR